MEIWLQALIGTLAALGIVAVIYMIFAYRRVGIVTRKLDYLIEDLTYKSEMITPALEAIVKIGNYLDLLDGIMQQKTESLIKYASNNKDSIYKVASELKEIIKEK